MFKKIAIVADHRGEPFKEVVALELKKLKAEYVMPIYDMGADNDYPDVVKSAHKLFVKGEVDGLILLCGTGVGMCIGANKCKGLRCVWAANAEVAKMGRYHEDCNSLALGVNFTDETLDVDIRLSKQKIQKIIQAFITTQFGGGRHARRVEKLNKM